MVSQDISSIDLSSCANEAWGFTPLETEAFPEAPQSEISPLELFEAAIAQRDIGTMDALLREHGDLISLLEEKKRSPLTMAILSPDTFLYLLQHRAHLDAVDPSGKTAIEALIHTMMPLLPLERARIYETSLHAHRYLTPEQKIKIDNLQFNNHPVLTILANGESGYVQELLSLISFNIASSVFSVVSYSPSPFQFVPEIFDQKLATLDSLKKQKLIASIAHESKEISEVYGVIPHVCAWAHASPETEAYSSLSKILQEHFSLSADEMLEIKNILNNNKGIISHPGASALHCIKIYKEGYGKTSVKVENHSHFVLPTMPPLSTIPTTQRRLYWF